MGKPLEHWTYEDVAAFLKERDFYYFNELAGVGRAWIKFYDHGGPDRIVEIGTVKGGFTVRAMKKMICQSGIEEKEWIEWHDS
ncbi:MAG TPA: hypothetical protein VH280_10945 [Verrucomicrobiae bacterium]|jgi:hypothetical protein|nr:hypothetical protein [Verrucomicrobiae bacterium]